MIGKKASTHDKSIKGFITATETRPDRTKVLFSYFNNGTYCQEWVYPFEIIIED